MTDESMTPTSKSPFDSILRVDGSKEYWLARELMPLLGYKRWERVPDVINRAMAACENSGNSVSEQFFEEARRINKGAGRPQQDYRLSRYACYLVAMNGDPRKAEIAQAQTYFAIKTMEAETQQSAPPKSQAEMLIIYAQEFFAHDQRLKSVESDVQEMKQIRIDAIKELRQLPPSKEEAPPLTERASVRQLVNKWCDANNVNQQVAWRKLYTELYYRDGFSVNSRMKKGEYKTKLDLIASCGKISVLYSIACDIFRNDNGQGGSHA
jgi:BRO family, N-terminal domain